MRQIKISPAITYRDDILKIYFKETNKYELITIHEEFELAQLIRQGDKEALDRLVRANLRFVISAAKTMSFGNGIFPDLISEGNLGLIEAASRFDASKGVRFISFAVWHIRRYFYNYLQLRNMIRIPFNQSLTLSKINKIISDFEQVNHRVPTNEEIVDLTDFSLNQVKDSRSPVIPVVSIDEYVNDDQSMTFGDTLINVNSPNADEFAEFDSLALNRSDLLNILPQRGIKIISMFFGLNNCTALTLDEIGVEMNLSTERTRQIKDSCILQAKLAVKNRRPISDYI